MFIFVHLNFVEIKAKFKENRNVAMSKTNVLIQKCKLRKLGFSIGVYRKKVKVKSLNRTSKFREFVSPTKKKNGTKPEEPICKCFFFIMSLHYI